MHHAAQLGRKSGELRDAGVEVLVIGPGGRGAASAYRRMTRLPVPVLADERREVFRAYGFKMKLRVLQQSGTALVDRDGVLRYIHRATNPQNALDMDALLEAVGRLPA